MTYLQLFQDAKVECGITGAAPTTVASQTGDLARLVTWLKDAYSEIQGRHGGNWKWLKKPFTVNTVAHTDTYAYGVCTDTEAAGLITRFRRFRADDASFPFTIYLTSGGVSGEQRMIFMPFSLFQRIYRFGVQRSTYSPPIHVSMDENLKMVVGPNPDAIYTVGGWFQRSAQTLSVDGDTPEMPADFHKLIVYEAMKKYAGYKSAADVMGRAVAEGGPMMRRLEANQMPQFEFGGPLA